MRRLALVTFGLTILLGLSGCGPSQVQSSGTEAFGPGNSGGMRTGTSGGGGGMSAYDKDTFMTINITVDKSGENEENPDGGIGLHLYTTTNSGKSYTIHVAPQFYIDDQNIKFNNGEKLKVSGSHFTGGPTGGDNIYASRITRISSNTTIQFRDPNTGEGVWKQYMKSKMQKMMREKMRKKIRKEVSQKNATN